MIQLINRRNALRTGLLASGGLAVLSQLWQGCQPPHDVQRRTNKAIVGRWFTNSWGKTCNLGIVDELDLSVHGCLTKNRFRLAAHRPAFLPSCFTLEEKKV
jgi:hypothetical protein